MHKKTYLFLLFLLFAYSSFAATPIKEIPNLSSITFHERTGSVSTYQFSIDSDELNNRIPGTLSAGNNDFQGWPGNEFYDVFISDYDGTPNTNGAFISAEVIFNNNNSGGGLNITAVELNFTDGSSSLCKILASFFAHGNNYNQGSEINVVDGDITTHCTMGNTNGINGRLRITVGVDYIYSDIFYEGCENDGYNLEINGIAYNELNPFGTDTIFGGNGCDPIFNINLNFTDCGNDPEPSNCQLFIPNVISPNNDGFNDFFEVFKKPECELAKFQISIFDRWGNMLFESTDPAFKWNGKLKSKAMDLGVVVWRMEYQFAGQEKINNNTGDLMIITKGN